MSILIYKYICRCLLEVPVAKAALVAAAVCLERLGGGPRFPLLIRRGARDLSGDPPDGPEAFGDAALPKELPGGSGRVPPPSRSRNCVCWVSGQSHSKWPGGPLHSNSKSLRRAQTRIPRYKVSVPDLVATAQATAASSLVLASVVLSASREV